MDNNSKKDLSSSSPSPKPLTPKTQAYSSNHLCYAPVIKVLEKKKTNMKKLEL
tara:strand:+ start:6045 stop:6203 length:159 start_codon:yes stop_codon:yes gene_type:complete